MNCMLINSHFHRSNLQKILINHSTTLTLFEKEKPQRNFQSKVDNTSLPFIPKIRVKPNSLVPLSG